MFVYLYFIMFKRIQQTSEKALLLRLFVLLSLCFFYIHPAVLPQFFAKHYQPWYTCTAATVQVKQPSTTHCPQQQPTFDAFPTSQQPSTVTTPNRATTTMATVVASPSRSLVLLSPRLALNMRYELLVPMTTPSICSWTVARSGHGRSQLLRISIVRALKMAAL